VPLKLGGSRLVVHIQTAPEAVEEFLALVRELAEEKRKSGFVRAAKELNGHVPQDVHVRIRDGVYSE
jgi:threonine aldolase